MCKKILLSLLVLFVLQPHARSSGTSSTDALGVCSVPSSGAFNSSGLIFCPKGMHKTIPPTRTDSYSIRTGDSNPLNDADEYLPDSILEIHVRTHNRYMKWLGIMIYAVKAGTYPHFGCPQGCDGKLEEKVGDWEIVDDTDFKTTRGGQILTHSRAKKHRFHHVFRFRTPPPGTGTIIFRTLLKQGATNGGVFYWPMIDGDLQLREASAYPNHRLHWIQGSKGKTCRETCSSRSLKCDPDAVSNIDAWDQVKYATSCKFPLLSECSGTQVHQENDGFCVFHDDDLCVGVNVNVTRNICTGVLSSGSIPVCPCEGKLNYNRFNPFTQDGNNVIDFMGADSSSSNMLIGLFFGLLAALCVCFAGIYYYFAANEKERNCGSEGTENNEVCLPNCLNANKSSTIQLEGVVTHATAMEFWWKNQDRGQTIAPPPRPPVKRRIPPPPPAPGAARAMVY